MIDPLIVELAAVRVELGLSQQAVAQAMGTQQSVVSQLECGVKTPRLPTFRRYCRALGYTLAVVALPDEELSPEVPDAS